MNLFKKKLNGLLKDKSKPNKISLDSAILSSVLLLISFGIIMVYSSSIAYASKASGHSDQYFYLWRHVFAVLLGFIAAILTFNIPSKFWQKHANLLMIGAIVLLIIVLIPQIGKEVNGARRWLPFGWLNLQPSEIAKLASVVYLANYLCGKSLNLEKFRHDILPLLITLGVIFGLLLLEPDMGATMVIFLIALTMLYLNDLDVRLIIGTVIFGVIASIGLIIFEPYRVKRVIGFLNPWEDSLGKGYQLTHSLLAYGNGGWFGVGLGNSLEKLYYLPEAHTDFVMAIVGEEFGMAGVIVVLLLFWIIFYRGFTTIGKVAKLLPGRKFQGLLAQGISIWLFAQAMVNIGVSLGVLPTKGLPLPFISYGGSSILINFIAIAILLKIDYENKLLNQNNLR